ncbi:hypothetical protein GOB86_14245 [Acetobacter lambici]|uniref:Uncharacterized protein n=1 Tax=Acetobacter lambici TaxID=1332824 RepID=A0ABT1F4M9_9PROT|nr:hypothetical protein [Acetobacter lambici]MCP1244227.1 hypothetical protein [Acetobacter lambici]MCP1260165.1 hypothetical protein [Acetobacter lambici]NHO58180.1 hypothetical protein [Acetobacter lambici]
MLGIPEKPPQNEIQLTERLKLAAAACQNLALTLVGLSLISPFFAAGGWSWRKLPAVMVAAILERAAFEFLSYIPAKETSKEDKQ